MLHLFSCKVEYVGIISVYFTLGAFRISTPQNRIADTALNRILVSVDQNLTNYSIKIISPRRPLILRTKHCK